MFRSACLLRASVLAPAAGGFFMTTKPDRSRCSTRRFATIPAMISSALSTRLRPLKRSAKASASARSSRAAGLRLSVGSSIGRGEYALDKPDRKMTNDTGQAGDSTDHQFTEAKRLAANIVSSLCREIDDRMAEGTVDAIIRIFEETCGIIFP